VVRKQDWQGTNNYKEDIDVNRIGRHRGLFFPDENARETSDLFRLT